MHYTRTDVYTWVQFVIKPSVYGKTNKKPIKPRWNNNKLLFN